MIVDVGPEDIPHIVGGECACVCVVMGRGRFKRETRGVLFKGGKSPVIERPRKGNLCILGPACVSMATLPLGQISLRFLSRNK